MLDTYFVLFDANWRPLFQAFAQFSITFIEEYKALILENTRLIRLPADPTDFIRDMGRTFERFGRDYIHFFFPWAMDIAGLISFLRRRRSARCSSVSEPS